MLLCAPLAAAQETAPAPLAAPGAATVAAPPTTTDRPARHHRTRGDPLEGFNRAMFGIHNFFDRLFFHPLAKVYETVVPKALRTGFRHVFSNLHEPVVFVNDVLQLKPKRALRTLARFTINSTLGVGGVLDLATAEHPDLKHHDNSFGTTLGRYGIGPGPYLFLPLFGPSDFRDFIGGQADTFGLRYAIGTPYDRAEYIFPETIITGLDLRVESEGELHALLGGAVDPYATLRSAYLQDRAATVAELRGKPAGAGALDDPLTDPAPGAGAPATPEAAPPTIDTVTTPPPVVTLPL